MLDKKTYERLMDKLDESEFNIQVLHKVPSPADTHSVDLIFTKDTIVNNIPKDKLELAHTMLHLFNSNNSGRGLSKATIKKLHTDIVPLLKKHSEFDGLDKR